MKEIKVNYIEAYDELEIGTKHKRCKYQSAYHKKYDVTVTFGFLDRKLVHIQMHGLKDIPVNLFDENKDALTNEIFVAFKNFQSKHLTFK